MDGPSEHGIFNFSLYSIPHELIVLSMIAMSKPLRTLSDLVNLKCITIGKL